MAATMTNTLAKQTNTRGINGKIGFQHLHIKGVVVGKFDLRFTVSLSDSLFFYCAADPSHKDLQSPYQL